MGYPKYPDTYKKTITLGGKEVTIEVGKFSEQVAAAVLITCGETVVHTTVGLGRKVNLGYFPLSVEFAEKLYSAGTIKGSRWIKRDGRPNDNVILKARVIDRSLRPMFPDGITNEVQVINTVFSYDEENDPDMLGLLGSTISMAISEIPFDGPLAGLRVGYKKETSEFSINPTHTEREANDLDLIVSGSGKTIVMVEAAAKEVSEDIMVEAMILAQKELGAVCDVIDEMVSEIGKEKVELISEEDRLKVEYIEELSEKIYAEYAKEVRDIVEKSGRLLPTNEDEVKATIFEKMNEGVEEGEEISEKDISSALSILAKKEARKMILEEGVRPDGRDTKEIRQIWCETDVFPRNHGSAMFKRGATQAITVTTLADPSLGQLVESIDGETTLHYMHHYNMPPYSFGGTGRFGFPKRREIGHGALAERALYPMIPSQADFPYTIHLVTEIMSSNGSTSQAAVCGSTMSLMAAGVPLKRPVSGIAMGLMSDGEKHVVLSDIQGLEDHVGDMDFKVAGTKEGITAIQMDIKLKGVSKEILEQALSQSNEGRMHILGEMMKAIDAPRDQISQYAPKVFQIEIPAEKIGALIGPGGKMIKSIIEETGAEINVDEDKDRELGIVNISSSEQEKIDAAVTIVSNLVRVMEVGDEFDGHVTRVENYGAFVEYLPGREGLVHVSEMSNERIEDVESFIKIGDAAHVRISEVKEDGKIGLSMISAEESAAKKAAAPPRRDNRGGGGRFSRDNRNGSGRDSRPRRDGFRRRDGR